MAAPVRWGIISTANIGRNFMRGVRLSKDSCVEAVASREWTRANEWAKEHGIPRVFGSYDELIGSNAVDVLYNPLPNSMHEEWTVKALEAGVPVLCEKPFASNAAGALRMVQASRQTGVLLGEAFMYRFHPLYDQVLRRIADGAIGDIVSIFSCFTFFLGDRTNIRALGELDGGSLMDVGCYCVNLSRRIAGCEPARAQAFERRTTVDDTLLGTLEFPNGILAHFECSIENHGHSRAEINGTKGSIVLPSPWFPGETEAQFILRRDGKEETITTEGANCYHLEVDDFVDAFRGKSPLRWDPIDAANNMAVLDALYASAKSGQATPVEKLTPSLGCA
jgi:predicted dehydrogenase